MDDKFSLKWNDFQTNVASLLMDLRNQKIFNDVTLVGEDQKQIPAHKIVLSASSGFFMKILQQNDQSNLVIYFESFDSTELENVLEYMYKGEVKIFKENLDRFLKIAEKLELKGLMKPDLKKNATKTEEKVDGSDSTLMLFGDFDEEPKNRDDSPKISGISQKLMSIFDFDEVSKIKGDTPKTNGVAKDESIEVTMKSSLVMKNFSSIEEVDRHVSKQIVRSKKGFDCVICNYTSNIQQYTQYHIYIHLKRTTFTCEFCGDSNIRNTREKVWKHRNCKNNQDQCKWEIY